MADLIGELHFLQYMSISESSRRTYNTGKMIYLEFCEMYGIRPFPAKEYDLNLFVSFLARNHSYNTIRTYLAAIRFANINAGFSSDFAKMDTLHMSLKGVKRLKGVFSRPKRQPVTIDTLKSLKNSLRTVKIDERDKLMLWAAFTTAFFAFLRSAEFCAPQQNSFDSRSCLLVKDVKVSPHAASVNIKVSKADPFRNGQVVRLSATGSSVCPLRALRNHLVHCKNQELPLFTFVDKSYLTRQRLTSTVRDLMKHSGAEVPQLSSHSFRIGAATTAAAAQVPDWLIKVLGRWSSNCYQQYIRTPKVVIDNVPRLLAKTKVNRS